MEAKQSVKLVDTTAQELAAMGHTQSMSRKFTPWSMFALTFNVLGTWAALAVNLSSGLIHGGSITIIWSLIFVTLCNLCVGLSLGELCSSMPTALGQAYWVSRIWKSPMGRFVSYACAWINIFGWWTLIASQNAFMTQIIIGMVSMLEENWPGACKGWLKFVIYLAITMGSTALNVVACRKESALNWFNNIMGAWYGAGFVVFSLVMLVTVGVEPKLSFQDSSFVFGRWINHTGWDNGVVWFLGLLQGAYGLTAFDAVIHLIEELPSPRTTGPKVIWLSIVTGAGTGMLLMIVCLFCIQDLDRLLNPPSGLPWLELMQQIIGPHGGFAIILIFTVNALGQGVSIITTSSRLTWGFARDGGLPFSSYLTHVDHYWKVPVRALWIQGAIVSSVGVLYFFAETVLQAITSVCTIALTISYGIPIFAVILFGKKNVPTPQFSIGKLAPLINWVGLIYCCITSVLFFFSGSPSPTSSTMNYAIVVFGVMVVVSICFWFAKGKRTYMRTDGALAEILHAERLEAQEPE